MVNFKTIRDLEDAASVDGSTYIEVQNPGDPATSKLPISELGDHSFDTFDPGQYWGSRESSVALRRVAPGKKYPRPDDMAPLYHGRRSRMIGESMDDMGVSLEHYMRDQEPGNGLGAITDAFGSGLRHVVWSYPGLNFDAPLSPTRLNNATLHCIRATTMGGPPSGWFSELGPMINLNGLTEGGRNFRLSGAFHGRYRKTPASTSVRALQIINWQNIDIDELILEDATTAVYISNSKNVRIRKIVSNAVRSIEATSSALGVTIDQYFGNGTPLIAGGADVVINHTRPLVA